MDIISYTEARNNFANYMQKVWDDRTPVAITRNKHKPVVMMSKEDYDSMIETMHLFSSEANSDRLKSSLKNSEKGNLLNHDLLD